MRVMRTDRHTPSLADRNKRIAGETIDAFLKAIHDGDREGWIRYIYRHCHDDLRMAAVHALTVQFLAESHTHDLRRNSKIQALEQRCAALESQLAVSPELEKRIAAVEDRSSLEWRGVWSQGATYQKGNVVTWDGGMWHSNVDQNRGARPGPNPSRWTLCVKAGRDGKDRV